MRATVYTFLRTLRRLPPDVVLDIAGREIEPYSPTRCLCGWALRAGLGRAAGLDAARVNRYSSSYSDRWDHTPARLVRLFGGREREWENIFNGVMHDGSVGGSPSKLARIEAAMVARLFEVVNGGHA